MVPSNQQLREQRDIAVAVVGWLDEHGDSPRTQNDYRAIITQFTLALSLVGLPLNGELHALADVIQVWSKQPLSRHRAKPLANASINKRLDTLSSFYEYAKRRGYVTHNPVLLVKRPKKRQYEHSKAIGFGEVAARITGIDRTTLLGKRDRALLTLALMTGRRISEIANLTWGDMEIDGDHMTLTFHAKGGKVMRDEVVPDVSRALLNYLHELHGPDLALPPTQPIWVGLSTHHNGKQISVWGIGKLCAKYLGTSNFHRLRHTFALAMHEAGADITEIQARLGHTNINTTMTYLARLRESKNPYSAKLAEMFGLGEE